MKFLKIAALSVLLITTLYSCKKDKTETPFEIQGKWEGKIGTGSATPDGFFAINVKSNGILERLNNSGAVSATGTWQLAGSTFTGTYTFTSGTVITFSSSLDVANKKLAGNWQNSASETGTWHATKKLGQ